MKNRLQVKDITDEEVYKIIREKKSIYNCLPYPPNLITAKLMKMVKQNKLDYGVSIAYPFIK